MESPPRCGKGARKILRRSQPFAVPETPDITRFWMSCTAVDPMVGTIGFWDGKIGTSYIHIWYGTSYHGEETSQKIWRFYVEKCNSKCCVTLFHLISLCKNLISSWIVVSICPAFVVRVFDPCFTIGRPEFFATSAFESCTTFVGPREQVEISAVCHALGTCSWFHAQFSQQVYIYIYISCVYIYIYIMYIYI